MFSTLVELTVAMEARFPVHPEVVATSPAPTGEVFAILGYEKTAKPGLIMGEVRPGHYQRYFPTEEAAVASAWAAFNDYAEDKKGTLYWRIKPVLFQQLAVESTNESVVYTRLLISEKPVITAPKVNVWINQSLSRLESSAGHDYYHFTTDLLDRYVQPPVPIRDGVAAGGWGVSAFTARGEEQRIRPPVPPPQSSGSWSGRLREYRAQQRAAAAQQLVHRFNEERKK